MEMQKTCYTPAFGANFTNNKAFQEVVQYASENKCLRTLDSALNTIKKANSGEITAVHGRNANGDIYSFFTVGRRTVPSDTGYASTPAEATFDGIMELSRLTKKFKSLMGIHKVKQNINPESLTKEYTV